MPLSNHVLNWKFCHVYNFVHGSCFKNFKSPLTNFIKLCPTNWLSGKLFQVIPKLIKFSIWSDSKNVTLVWTNEYFKPTLIIIINHCIKCFTIKSQCKYLFERFSCNRTHLVWRTVRCTYFNWFTYLSWEQLRFV